MNRLTLILVVTLGAACRPEPRETRATLTSTGSVAETSLFQASAETCTPYGSQGFFGCKAFEARLALPGLTASTNTFVATSGRTYSVAYTFQCKSGSSIQGHFVTDSGAQYKVASTKAAEKEILEFTTFARDSVLTLKLPAHAAQIGTACALVINRAFAMPNTALIATYAKRLSGTIKELSAVSNAPQATGDVSVVKLGLVSGKAALETFAKSFQIIVDSESTPPEDRDIASAGLAKINLSIAEIVAAQAALDTGCSNTPSETCASAVAKANAGVASILERQKAERAELVAFLIADIDRLNAIALGYSEEAETILKNL